MHLIHSGGFYGAEAVILNLCLGMLRQGHRPLIGCFLDEGMSENELGRRAGGSGIDVRYIPFRSALGLECVGDLKRIADEEGVTVFHSHGYKPSFLCMVTRLVYGLSYVITCHLWTRETAALRVYNAAERIAMLFATRIVGVSSRIVEDITRVPGLARKTTLIRNGIDFPLHASQPKGAGIREELGISRDTLLVGTFGRLVNQKAQHVLIDAFGRLVGKGMTAHLLIGGEGGLRPKLERQAEMLGCGDTIHFLGFRNDVAAILGSLDLFVLSSIDEGLPIILLEAMWAGVPIVSTAVGEIPYVIEDGVSGMLVVPGDAGALAQCIERLLHDRRLGEGLGGEASRRARSGFSLQTMVDSYLDVYRFGHGSAPAAST
jgi:glycosyltransferase involved in cell wall biosynthesis